MRHVVYEIQKMAFFGVFHNQKIFESAFSKFSVAVSKKFQGVYIPAQGYNMSRQCMQFALCIMSHRAK